MRYKHLCNFSHFQKCDNYVITPSNVSKNFQDSNLSEQGQKYPHMPKISPEGLPVSSINSEHINIYIYFNRVLIVLARIRLLGRFTTCLAQTTTASRLLFAQVGISCLKNGIYFGNFRVKIFCTIMMTY